MMIMNLGYILVVFVIGLRLGVDMKIIAGISFIPAIPHLYRIVRGNRLPGDSGYNPLGFIELHVACKAKRKRREFIKMCVDTIKVAKAENKGVLFLTWLFSEKKLKDVFGDAIEISNPSWLERALSLSIFFNGIKPLPNPYIKCYIDTTKLPEDFEERYRQRRKTKELL